MRTRSPHDVRRALATLGLAAAISLALTLATACDHGPAVRIENSSAQVVVVYQDGEATDLMRPGITQEFWVPKFAGSHVFEIRALEGGQTLASRSFTWEELEEGHGITIVVE